jgi:hypothetical protein
MTMNAGLVIPADRKLRDANKRANEQADKLAKQPQRATVRHRRQEQGQEKGKRRAFLAPCHNLGHFAFGSL